MTRAYLQSVLLEDDGPLIVVVRDRLDGIWLGMAYAEEGSGSNFLFAPVSARRLAAFQQGHVDLRSVFTELEDGHLATAYIEPSEAQESGLDLEVVQDVPPEWLPDSGFVLSAFRDPVPEESATILTDLVARRRTLVHLNFNPQEAQEAHVIDASTLADGLNLFQNAHKQAYLLWRRTAGAAIRRIKASIDDWTLQAYAVHEGSFEIHLQAKTADDLFGYASQVEALRKLDEITAVIDKPEEALQVAIKYQGHYVSAVRQLLRFIATKKVPLRYTWIEPTTAKVSRSVIRPEAAETLYAELTRKEELSQQNVTYTGRFVDLLHQGRWSMETTDGETVSGSLVPEARFSLSGVSYGDRLYEIDCLEIQDQAIVSGTPSSTILLVSPPREVKPTL